jgi:REP element-mobilizing transposase RayT
LVLADGLEIRPTKKDGRIGNPSYKLNKQQLSILMPFSVWNLPPPPGFQGLNPENPVTMYLRHLPHWRRDGATYFVTFRLYDSLPQSKLRELDTMRREWERRHPPPQTEDQLQLLARETMRRVERWLDQGMGSCVLKDPALAREMASALRHFDGQRYELGCFVIMPNHVHAIVRPLQPDTQPLEKILQSWKRHSGLKINQVLGHTGPQWQEESFDRIIRDEEHLYRCIQYVGSNPDKAGLEDREDRLWIRPAWVQLGWGFTP